jgi:hypothetical protein
MAGVGILVLTAVGAVLACLLACYLFMAVAAAGMIANLSRLESRDIVPDNRPDVLSAAHCHAWASAHGFVLRGAYRALGVTTAVWVHSLEPTHLCLYSMRGNTYTDFATQLGGRNDVTTASSRDGLLWPLPVGVWKQAFPGKELDQLWLIHQEATRYVRGRSGVGFAQETTDFPEALVGGIRREMEHVRSLPLWPLRLPYWYFVRRRRLLNKTVREQVESGLAR